MPVLLGIPWLAAILATAFTSLFVFFAKLLTKRLAIVLVAITMIVGLTAAFTAAIYGLVFTISSALPSFFTTAIMLVVPVNAYACAGVLTTAYLLRWAYIWNVKIIEYKLF